MPTEIDNSKPKTEPLQLIDFYSLNQGPKNVSAKSDVPVGKTGGSIDFPDPFGYHQGLTALAKALDGPKANRVNDTTAASSKDKGGTTTEVPHPFNVECKDGMCRILTPAEVKAKREKLGLTDKPEPVIKHIGPNPFAQGDKDPAKPVVPVMPLDVKPTSPLDSKPVVPLDTKPVVPLDTKPVVPLDTKPVAPLDTKPVAPLDTKPVAPLDTKPVAPLDTKPVAPLDTKPVAPLDTKPVAPLDTKPVAPLDTKPVAPIIIPVEARQPAPLVPPLETKPNTSSPPDLPLWIVPRPDMTTRPSDKTNEVKAPIAPSGDSASPIVQAYERRQGARHAGTGLMPAIDAIPGPTDLRPPSPGPGPGPRPDIAPWTVPKPELNPNIKPNDASTDRAELLNKLEPKYATKDIAKAVKMAKDLGIPLAVHIGTPDCHYCTEMERDTWPSIEGTKNEKGSLQGKVVILHVNLYEKGNLQGESRKLVDQVTSNLGTGVPVLRVFNFNESGNLRMKANHPGAIQDVSQLEQWLIRSGGVKK